ncbi:hypothetical protein CAC42_6528 [Sphaceloma murrayae]|uniref:non-specific serine/threonine protein kinase n=1 Tax=Sphaceloma murrayae TaxID=2082308 RepID=A0A2K1QFT7_9PEZI|nr:hypothetical protein CAC42_6528 [Sphaceloma murrayae]
MTDPNPDNPLVQRSDEQPPVVSPSASDVTPRVEKPLIIATQPTPLPSEPLAADGFFAVKPADAYDHNVEEHTQHSPTLSATSSSTSSSKLRDAVLDVARRMSAQIDLGSSTRPTVQRDLSHASAASVESTDSTATIMPTSPRQGRASVTFGPPVQFPNQAFSALHHQHYPPPHLPPQVRTGLLPSHPATNHSGSPTPIAIRTNEHSSALTPGLFSPSPVRSTSGTPISEAAYPSPYLHHLHTQVPKETHVADIDVDPISGRKLINDYEIIDELGRGTHGKVKLGRSLTTGDFVAIKIVERFPKKRRLGRLGNAEDKVKREVAILKKARHPHIVALLEVIDDPARRKVYIVLERVDMGEIPWRTQGSKEICLVETRRYDRESHGIFDDEEAEKEDDAILGLSKLRRVKAARARFKELRRAHQTNEVDPSHWSMELAPDVDEDSELDSASRSGSYSDSLSSPELDRIISRSSESLHPSAPSDLLATVTPESNRHYASESNTSGDELVGTMYGAFMDPNSPPDDSSADLRIERDQLPRLEEVITEEDAKADLRGLTRNLSLDNLAQRAADLLDENIHPDLMYVPCMTMTACRESFRDTLLGLQYLHYQGIIHRDIKPPNLLQTRDYRTKISDFGVSYLGRPIADLEPDAESETDHDFDEAKELAKNVGTAAFYAPELCFTDTEDHPPIGKAIDVWALGVTLFCMIFARVPFVDTEFVVMRRIAEEEVYIPNKRLRPVEMKPHSRSSSHNRQWGKYSAFRTVHTLEYEEVPDDLIDLLKRLLTKDVRNRVSLDEVRFHPWVTADLPDRDHWLDTSNPAKQAEGKKIEISREDLETSVVPITIMDKIRSGLMKAVGSVGLGRSSSTRRRNASQDGSGASASSSTSNIHADLRDFRRHSLRGDEPILQALKSSRESDHPLAKSLTVSPVTTPHAHRIANTTSLGTPRADVNALTPTQNRLPRKDEKEKMASTLSTTASVRTIRPGDAAAAANPGYFDSSPPTSPTVPFHPESPSAGADRLSGLLGSATRLLKSVRDRSATGRSDDKGSVISTRSSDAGGDAHGDPSVAVSTASASGTLNPPRALKDFTPASSKPVSPTTSRQSSLVTTPDLSARQGGFEDFKAATGSPIISSHVRNPIFIPDRKPPTPQTRPVSRLQNESTEEDYDHAETELLRRQVAEGLQKQASSPAPSHNEEPCPPSPDDDLYRRRGRPGHFAGASCDSMPRSLVAGIETGPTSPSSSVMPAITPVSSEDRINTGPTPATSTPSIPSVISEDHYSEMKQGTPLTAQRVFGESEASFDQAPYRPEREPFVSAFDPQAGLAGLPTGAARRLNEDDDEYHADHAVESEDEDDDSSDDDGGLQMMGGRRHPTSPPIPQRSTSVNVANLSRFRERRETGGSNVSKKSERSGSGGTMRKVKPGKAESDPEDERGERKLSASLAEDQEHS